MPSLPLSSISRHSSAIDQNQISRQLFSFIIVYLTVCFFLTFCVLGSCFRTLSTIAVNFVSGVFVVVFLSKNLRQPDWSSQIRLVILSLSLCYTHTHFYIFFFFRTCMTQSSVKFQEQWSRCMIKINSTASLKSWVICMETTHNTSNWKLQSSSVAPPLG